MLTGNKRADIVAIAVLLCIFAISSSFLSDFRSLATSITFGVFYIVISLKIKLKSKLWFWLVIGIFLLLHIVIIAAENPNLPSGPSIAYITPAVFVDIFGMLAIIAGFEFLWSNRRSQ
jgi:hypothetical protein